MPLEKKFLNLIEAARKLYCDPEILMEHASEGRLDSYSKFHNQIVIISKEIFPDKLLKMYASETHNYFETKTQAWYMAGHEEYCSIPQQPIPVSPHQHAEGLSKESARNHLFKLFKFSFSYCEKENILVYKIPSLDSDKYKIMVMTFHSSFKNEPVLKNDQHQKLPEEYLLQEGKDYSIYGNCIQLLKEAKKGEIIAIFRNPDMFKKISHYTSREPEKLQPKDILDIKEEGKIVVNRLYAESGIKLLLTAAEVNREKILFLSSDIEKLQKDTDVDAVSSELVLGIPYCELPVLLKTAVYLYKECFHNLPKNMRIPTRPEFEKLIEKQIKEKKICLPESLSYKERYESIWKVISPGTSGARSAEKMPFKPLSERK